MGVYGIEFVGRFLITGFSVLVAIAGLLLSFIGGTVILTIKLIPLKGLVQSKMF